MRGASRARDSTRSPETRELARERIYAVVDSIPPGKVATYGQVAGEAGLGRGARQVGATLGTLPGGRDIPWFRVVNSKGRISPRPSGGEREQRRLLEAEGIDFSARGAIDLERHGWRPEE